ncbi:hypothetical protein ABKV19_025304 [Rosa sericea]
MASPRSSTSAWLSPPSTSSTSLASSATTAPVPSPPKFDTVLSSSPCEPAVSPPPQSVTPVSQTPFDLDQVMGNFPRAQIVDYHETQTRRVVSPSPSSKELVLYKPETQRQENLQERLGQVIKDLVHVTTFALETPKEVTELMKLAEAEIAKERKAEHDSSRSSMQEEASESMKEDNKLMIVAVEEAQADHESPKITNTEPTFTTRPGRSATKLMAHISNVSFQMPDDFEVDDDTINEFVPNDEVLREITAQGRKKYSFFDRLHGWKMECRLRLNGVRQFDKYFTHVQSKIVTRSIPEVVRFILYEVSPKQMREANSKRKSIDFWDPANESPKNILKDEYPSMSSEGADGDFEEEEESYVHMFLRMAWSNLMNGTAEEVPLLSEWEKFKAAKKKARTAPCKPEVGTSNLDAEAVETANALMGLADDEMNAEGL